ncbi:MAG: CapA family protein, partial [Acidimicrobiia bacterium]
ADPAMAEVVSAAGFDLMSLANNHSGDAGAEGLLETIEVLEAAGMRTVGSGIDRSSAAAATRFEVGGTKVVFLAFDASGGGLAASTGPGVATWDESDAKKAVESAAEESDLLVVSLHGGVEYLPESDPRMLAIGEKLTDWGADVVWGHGAHVAQPVLAQRSEDGKPNLIATSLGNFIFDQRGPQTGKGMVMQLLADQSGLIAYRLGATSHADLRVRWQGWELPEADAVLLKGEWWTLVRAVHALPNTSPTLAGFTWGTVVAASEGRLTGDVPEIVVSFRKIPGPHPVRDGLTDLQWVDADGRTAHVGIYTTSDLSPIWVAGMVPAPVAGLAVCDGSIAFAYSTFDDPTTVATGAAVWRQIGLDAAATLPGRGRPGCVDVDSDGFTEPVILDREPAES